MIAATKKVGKPGKARIGEVRKVIRKIKEERKVLRLRAISLVWVKSYIGIISNEETHKKVKLGPKKEECTFPVIRKVGLKKA